MIRRLILVCALILPFGGCQRPTREQCETLCWRYVELNFWEEFNKSVEGKSEAEIEELRAEKEKEWEKLRAEKVNHARDNCLTGCRQSGDPDMVKCVEKAETAAQAKACIDD